MNVPKKIEPVRAFAVLTTRKSNEKYNEKEMENELKEIISSQLEKRLEHSKNIKYNSRRLKDCTHSSAIFLGGKQWVQNIKQIKKHWCIVEKVGMIMAKNMRE